MTTTENIEIERKVLFQTDNYHKITVKGICSFSCGTTTNANPLVKHLLKKTYNSTSALHRQHMGNAKLTDKNINS